MGSYGDAPSPILEAYRAHLLELIKDTGEASDHGTKACKPTIQAPSDPLTVLHGAIGLIADSIQISNTLDDLNTSPQEETSAIEEASCISKDFMSTSQALYRCFRQMEFGVLPHSHRPSLINLELVIALLTETILAFSETAIVLVEISLEATSLGIESPEPICYRYATPLTRQTDRLRETNSLLKIFLSVLKCEDEAEAKRHNTELLERSLHLIQSNPLLLDRLSQLGDKLSSGMPQSDSDKPSEHSIRRSTQKRKVATPADGTDTDTDSFFSGLSFGDVLSLSTVPLPIHPTELQNGSFYIPAYCMSIRDDLDAVGDTQLQHRTSAIARALGLREPREGQSDSTTKQPVLRPSMPQYDYQSRPLGLRVGAYADQVWRQLCEPGRLRQRQ